MTAAAESRLALAKALRELADGSSEAALRSGLSRSYYSIYHAANALLGKVDHHDIAERLGSIDPELREKVEKLQQLRAQADYDPRFVEREFKGDMESFRVDAKKNIDEGLRVFNRVLRSLVKKTEV